MPRCEKWRRRMLWSRQLVFGLAIRSHPGVRCRRGRVRRRIRMRAGLVCSLLLSLWSSSALAGDGSTTSSGGQLHCRRSLGLAVGVNQNLGASNWEEVGQGLWAPALSPVFALGCGRSLGPVAGSIGFESAPWYIQIRPDGERMRQFATATVGLGFGRGPLTVGPHATAGFTGLGAGATLAWLPNYLQNDAGGGGIEVRATAFRLGAPGFQGMMLYSMHTQGRKR
jgi:hypothetical protein